ncbi:MAG TPA: hypothetical protein VE244_12355 [Nitrososphaeraceae archaeon]|nr:hypothetical protein [Nitrososphaeraceae archaeon]
MYEHILITYLFLNSFAATYLRRYCKQKDPDGNITSYSWKQIAGHAVILDGADTTTPSFTAPNRFFVPSLKLKFQKAAI